MKLTVLLLGLLFLLPACADQSPGGQEKPSPSPGAPAPAASAPPPPAIELKTFHNENGTWGYDIYLGGKRYIHQPDKPAVGGRQGFERELQAQKVAELVVEKIKRGIMPPSVTAGEVDSLVRVY